jgi:hypothetical protein
MWYKYIDHLLDSLTVWKDGGSPMGIEDVITRVEHAGDANRKTLPPTSKWLPAANSPLWGVYARYCKARNQEITAKVGRCHFWHVILILAPLYWLASYLAKPTKISFPVALLMLALVAGAVCATGFLTGEWVSMLIWFAGTAGVIGLVGGLIAYVAMVDDEKDFHEVLEYVVGEERFSWGAIALLLCGYGAAVGLLIAFLIHCIIKVCRWLQDTIGDAVVKLVKLSALAVMVIAGVGCIGWGLYKLLSSPTGWGVLAVIVLAGALVWRFRVQLGAVIEAGGNRWEARQERIKAEAVVSATPRRPSLKDRIARVGRGIVTALCVVRDLLRLAFTAAVYGYKQVCDLAPVPAHLLEQQEQTPDSEKEEVATV